MEERVCALTGERFIVTDNELAYYQKIGVPPPTLCPGERARKRMAFANQRHLFLRQCAGSGKRIVTSYPPQSSAPVFDLLYWYSDKWDKFATGREFDFTRPFFPQFAQLMKVAPRPNLQRAPSYDENSDYTNYAGKNKNCYLIFDSDKSWDCFYSYSINTCRDVVDCFRCEKCELCYECVDCINCYNSKFLQNCDTCSDSFFLKNCIGCSFCYSSVNLRNKQYYFKNKKCTKEEYINKLAQLQLSKHHSLQTSINDFHNYILQFPVKNLEGVQNENVFGDYLSNCKNAYYCFDSRNLWDCRYLLQAFDDAKDCLDCTEVGDGAELLYECCYVGYTSHFNRFVSHALGNSFNLTYCYYCPFCSDCFGCVGLHHAKYCILNHQYSEDDYRQLTAKIIEHMERTKEWGEFFPHYISPFPYNLSHAQDFLPLTKEEAVKLGYSWYEEEPKEYLPPDLVPPETIAEVQDSALQAKLACDCCGKNYKLQKAELTFYRKMNLPLPRQCPDHRHLRRLKLRNGRTLYHRKCHASSKEIMTTIPPDSPLVVLCEEEFLKQVE